TFNPVYPYDT
nr:Chain S, N-TERMINAL PEPTIDE OF FIBER PROTEIN [Human adenovirus 2]4V4U_T Chain T, N-TERMINAL PEPTIDE OF FIBER PROTEIN [Human adenovirus 2]4V4U_U Chain U, N-TERMINAL PEPTIDE OF FIBER PROTEIN [Human adenovirus 2]4V4U_V Chain V, N-TERMINAL PEPTIDE OF FIBER PROTEIN [Human adenovirus 2]4V4U_W Chain W, N-TERMINAL PEPTIDE OF FIBER PROTEIN [Human adenovirus 2]